MGPPESFSCGRAPAPSPAANSLPRSAKLRNENCDQERGAKVGPAGGPVGTRRRRRLDAGLLRAGIGGQLAFPEGGTAPARTNAAWPAGNQRLKNSRLVLH